eukprot:Sdes_comp15743_c0_seq1m4783
MEIIKRPLSPSSHQNTSKKPKNEVAVAQNVGKSIVASTPLRTSNLPAPIMLLSGHLGEVLTTRFSPCGKYIASGGTDKQIYLWSVFDKCENFSMLTGHRGAVLELCWSEDGSKIVSASSDKTVTIFDVETGRKIRQCRGHEGIVNSCSTNKGTPHQLIVSASDDGSVRVWDARKAKQISSFQQGYPLTACCFDETSDSVFAGGVGNVIQVSVVHPLPNLPRHLSSTLSSSAGVGSLLLPQSLLAPGPQRLHHRHQTQPGWLLPPLQRDGLHRAHVGRAPLCELLQMRLVLPLLVPQL